MEEKGGLEAALLLSGHGGDDTAGSSAVAIGGLENDVVVLEAKLFERITVEVHIGGGEVHVLDSSKLLEDRGGHVVSGLLERFGVFALISRTSKGIEEVFENGLVDGGERSLRSLADGVSPGSNHLSAHNAVGRGASSTYGLQVGVLILNVPHETTLGRLHQLHVADSRSDLGAVARHLKLGDATNRSRGGVEHVVVGGSVDVVALPKALLEVDVDLGEVLVTTQHVTAESETVVFDGGEVSLHGKSIACVLLCLGGDDLGVLSLQPGSVDVSLQHDLDDDVGNGVVSSLLSDLEDRDALLSIRGLEFKRHGDFGGV